MKRGDKTWLYMGGPASIALLTEPSIFAALDTGKAEGFAFGYSSAYNYEVFLYFQNELIVFLARLFELGPV